MKIIFIIYLIIVALCLLFIILGNIYMTQHCKCKKPEKIKKKNITKFIILCIRALIYAALPIFNIILLLMYVFQWERIVNKAIDSVETNKEES